MKKTLFTGAIVAMLALAGCSSPSGDAEGGASVKDSGPIQLVVSEPREEGGMPESEDSDFTATIKDGVLTYHAAGSSTCAPKVETAVLEGTTITLTRPSYEGKPCTMDLRPLVQEITRADGVKLEDTFTVKLAETK